MFICEGCLTKNYYNIFLPVSHGACELCGEVHTCCDIPSGRLSRKAKVPTEVVDEKLYKVDRDNVICVGAHRMLAGRMSLYERVYRDWYCASCSKSDEAPVSFDTYLRGVPYEEALELSKLLDLGVKP